jgi:hypothetical protein
MQRNLLLLKLFAYFAAGLVSEYFLIKYYKSITQDAICAAIIFNMIIMNLNAYFINIVTHGNYFWTNVYVIGQSIGILIAFRKRKNENKKFI